MIFKESVERYIKEYGVWKALHVIYYFCTQKMVEVNIENKYPRKLKRIKKIVKIIDKAIDKIIILENE